MSAVRTRIAPSPTGDPHVGTAYIALFNLCFAKKANGKFILRIEDTDRVRSTPESEQAIYDSLKWLGLNWDEGPDVGGDFGPYRQSERGDIYAKYCQELVDKDFAFKCYRTPEELDQLREKRKAEGLHTALKPSDLILSVEEIKKRESTGQPYVIRMRVPEEDGVCVVTDMLRGEIECDWGQVDAQILLKSDGMPTYHLANVVDDHLMQITHVLRGEEWINSAPKHKLLYEYFGWDMPELCHLPLLRNPDKSKLSKRKNPTSIGFYQRMGFLPEALVNYLGRMGWSMPDEREKFSLDDMLENFDIQRVSLGGPIFDMEKLKWLNGKWIREDLSAEDLMHRLKDWMINKEYLAEILPSFQQRMEVMSDFAPAAAFLLSGLLEVSEEDFSKASKLEVEDQAILAQLALWTLEQPFAWEKDTLFSRLKALADFKEMKIKDFLAPLFIAVCGSTSSISVMEAMVFLGPDLTRARLRHAVNILGGISKKKNKKLEKEFASFLKSMD